MTDHESMFGENAILRRELMFQTGCTEEDIEELLRVGKTILNRRMGSALRKQFKAEEFRDAVLSANVSSN